MQLTLPWRSGQARPFGSIPRINWQHPLAVDLIFYGYDGGNGTIFDLAGSRPLAGTLSTGGIPDPVKSSAFGTAVGYGATGTKFFNSDAILRTAYTQLSWACGMLPTVAEVQQATPFMRTANNNNSPPFLNFGFQNTASPGNNYVMNYATTSSGTNTSSAITLTVNVYSSLLATISGTAYKFYTQGKQSTTGTAAYVPNSTQDAVCFSGNSSATIHQPFQGFVYYGAVWSRTLTAAEALQLHLDPYCFLIYPEDDIFAELVGASGSPTVALSSIMRAAAAGSLGAPAFNTTLFGASNPRAMGRAQASGAVPLLARALAASKSIASPSPLTALSARVQAVATGRSGVSAATALLSRATGQAKGSAQAIGKLALSAVGKGAAAARGALSFGSQVSLAAIAFGRSAARGGIANATALSAKIQAAAKGSAAPTGATSLSSIVRSMASGRGVVSFSGQVLLASIAAAKAMARGAMAGATSLSAKSEGMAKASAQPGVAQGLAARMLAAAKGRAQPSGLTSIFSRTQGQAKGQALTKNTLTLTSQTKGQASGTSQTKLLTALASTVRAMATGRANIAFGALAALVSIMRGMATGRGSSIGATSLSARTSPGAKGQAQPKNALTLTPSRATGMAKGAGQPSGAISLKSTAKAAARGRGAGSFLVSLSSVVRAQAMGRAAGFSSKISLLSRSFAKAAGRGALAGTTQLVALSGFGKAMAAGRGLLQLIRLNPNYIGAASKRHFVALASRRAVISAGLPRNRIVLGISNRVAQTNTLEPPIDDTVEQETVTFDFGRILVAGVTLQGPPTITCAVFSGSDPTPQSRILGSPAIVPSPNSGQPSQAISQLVGTMVGGVVYRLQCVCATSDGQTLSLWTHLTCDTPD